MIKELAYSSTALFSTIKKFYIRDHKCDIVNFVTRLLINAVHGQTLANRIKPGQSFPLKMWACLYISCNCNHTKTAELKVESSAKTTSRFSPISFHAPMMSL